MKCKRHKYACACREEFYRTDRIRMIRAFQEIRNVCNSLGFEKLKAIDAICREAIAPQAVKNVWQSGDPVNEK